MIRIAAACLAAAVLCTGCLTKEDIDCWYEDVCLHISNADAPAQQAPAQNAQAPLAGR